MFKQYKKLFLILLGFLLTINSVFAANTVFDSLTNFFGKNGIYGLLQNDIVVLVLIYIAMLVGFHNLIKIATNMVFRNNAKEAKIIAFVISFIGTTGIFFMYARGNNAGQIVALFGGTVGLFLVTVVLGSTLVAINRILNNFEMKSFKAPAWYIFMGLSVSVVVYILTALIAKIEQTAGNIVSGNEGSFFTGLKDAIAYLGGIGILAIIIGIIMWLTHRSRENNKLEKGLRERHPEINQAENIRKNLIEKVDRLNNLGKNLFGRMR